MAHELGTVSEDGKTLRLPDGRELQMGSREFYNHIRDHMIDSLREQLEWADRNGCLAVAAEQLRRMPEDAWYHMGD